MTLVAAIVWVCWTRFFFAGSSFQTLPADPAADQRMSVALASPKIQGSVEVTVISIENATDFYAAFMLARATGRSDLAYVAGTILDACASTINGSVLEAIRSDSVLQVSSDSALNSAALELYKKERIDAAQELTLRCRGFAVERDLRALRKAVWLEAVEGNDPLGRLLALRGLDKSVEMDDMMKVAIADALKSGERIAIEVSIKTLWGHLYDPRSGPNHESAWSPNAALALASQAAYGQNGYRDDDTVLRRLVACVAGVCPALTAIESPPPLTPADQSAYRYLIDSYTTGLTKGDIDSILRARPEN
ncbi:MAG: hypothetical protein ACK5TK_01820 [Betaproteobacteria bacterium]